MGMLRALQAWAAVSALGTAAPAAAQFQYYESGKFETPEASVWFVVHGLVHRSETHVPVWNNDFWGTDVTVSEAKLPSGDLFSITHFARHRTAPHAGEPRFGPAFKWGAMARPGQGAAVTAFGYGGGSHGDHTDSHFAVATVLYAGLEISSYFVMGGAVHFGDGSDILGVLWRFARAAGVLAVPPTKSPASGLCALASGRHGQAYLSVVVQGIRPEEILAADVRLAAPGEPGIPVLDLGPPDAWMPLENGSARLVEWGSFPPVLREPLRDGRLAVNVATWAHPTGEVRGQLVEGKPSLPHAGPG